MDEIKVDPYGRMLYHPEFHHKHKTPWSESDKEYLCKYWDYDDRRLMSFALGRAEANCGDMVTKLKKRGEFEYYKNLNKHW